MEFHLTENITFKPLVHKLIVNEEPRSLTRKQTELLSFLYNNKNSLTLRSEALKEIWGDNNYFNSRSMDVCLCYLRKTLADCSDIKIISIQNQGHKLIVPEMK